MRISLLKEYEAVLWNRVRNARESLAIVDVQSVEDYRDPSLPLGTSEAV